MYNKEEVPANQDVILVEAHQILMAAKESSSRRKSGGGERVKNIFPTPADSLITEDCATLRRRFLAKHSTSFSAFKLSWEELSFHTIYKYISSESSQPWT